MDREESVRKIAGMARNVQATKMNNSSYMLIASGGGGGGGGQISIILRHMSAIKIYIFFAPPYMWKLFIETRIYTPNQCTIISIL